MYVITVGSKKITTVTAAGAVYEVSQYTDTSVVNKDNFKSLCDELETIGTLTFTNTYIPISIVKQ